MAEKSSEAPVEEKVDEFKIFNGVKVLWPADMPDDILEFVTSSAQSAVETSNPEKDGAKIARDLKKQFDTKYGSHWHVVLGKSFGSHCLHEKGHFAYFYIGRVAFMIYKAGSG